MSYEKSFGKGNTIHKVPYWGVSLERSFLSWENVCPETYVQLSYYFGLTNYKKSGRTKSRVLQLMLAETVWNDDF